MVLGFALVGCEDEEIGQETLLEMVGFDTGLISTLDTAKVFKNYASYLVASEELEPGNGWYYSG